MCVKSLKQCSFVLNFIMQNMHMEKLASFKGQQKLKLKKN